MAVTGKIAEVFFESVLETIEDQTQLADMCTRFEPTPGDMQNANNFVWRPVEQQAAIQQGWDLEGLETEIIEETYPAILVDPYNDFVQQRADDLRDMEFWRRRGKRSGMQQVVTQNTAIADAIVTQGSMYYRSDTTSGFDFISEAQALLNEQQRDNVERKFILNDRTTQKFGVELAGRQTLQGRPADTWDSGQIGSNVAQFDVYTGSYLPNTTGGTASTTCTGNQTFAPEGGTVAPTTGIVTNVDYRAATIVVAATAAFAIGDKITIAGLNAVGISDKTDTGLLKTFTIVALPTGTTMTVYPKPIAKVDAALSTIELAYANVSTTIVNTAAVDQVNIDTSARANVFFDADAVEILSGTIPAELFGQFDGMKVINETMANGQSMYMIYDANLVNMNFRYRLFTWWGVTIKDPQRCGTAISY